MIKKEGKIYLSSLRTKQEEKPKKKKKLLTTEKEKPQPECRNATAER